MIEWATMAEVARLFGWSESYARKLAHRDGITQPEGVDVDRPTVGSVQRHERAVLIAAWREGRL